ncbi:MAG: hypothetical protein NUW00_04640 [Candidatus Kaiserbacteria bacterium]|nr:hypothetical protein [Candidatus Kaiserbacteria bacterium]
MKIKKKQGRIGKRPRVVVLYQPPYDSALGKHPHPVLIARGHFGSPDELTTECQARIGVLPRHHRSEGTVLVGHEIDDHIVSVAFEKKWPQVERVPRGAVHRVPCSALPPEIFHFATHNVAPHV